MSKRMSGGAFLAAEPGEILTPELLPADVGLMAGAAADFMRGEVLPAADRIEAKEPGLLPDLLRKGAQLGLMATDIPEVYGGLGLSKSASARVAEALAVEPSFAVSHSVHTTVATLPLVFFGTNEQKRRFLPQLASGELIGAYALSEAHAGSDAMAARTRAVASADGSSYRLTGEKAWITNGAFAGLFTVFAKVDDRMTAFLVEGNAPGVSVGREEHKLGLHGSSTCRVILEEAEVPAENVLGAVGEGGRIALLALNLGRFKIGASAVGQSKNLLGIATRYAKQRSAFGKPIAEHGLIRQKLATMAARIFAAESMLYRVAGCLDDAFGGIDPEGGDAPAEYRAAAEAYAIECAMVKVYATETLGYVADETLQIHGGYGYSEEFPAARAWRDARVTRIYEGTSEINRINIAGLLMKRADAAALLTPGQHAATHQMIVKLKSAANVPQQALGALADTAIREYALSSSTLRAGAVTGRLREASGAAAALLEGSEAGRRDAEETLAAAVVEADGWGWG